ncbi:MAG: 2Fe-2S iron-sulfur cluster-binding protein [Actinomycetes bacterium]
MTAQPHRQPYRLAAGGRVDRTRPLRFVFDGVAYAGFAGDTLASALLANGVHEVGRSVRLDRPRGVVSAGSEEPTAVVQVEEPFPEPMVTATILELYDGLVASSLRGRGRLATRPDTARYDSVHTHCDVLVVGAGPAGLAAAATAARSGARVVLVDEQPEPGGSLLGSGDALDDAPATDWVLAVADELSAVPDVRLLSRTTAFGYYDDNEVLAVERRTNHLGAAAPAHVARERVWRIRSRHVVLATGAHERAVAFADNDRPGVMLAGAARAYVHRYGVLPGRRAVVFASNDSGHAAARDLAAAGVEIAAVVDVRPEPPDLGVGAGVGAEVLAGHVVTGTAGAARVSSATLGRLGDGSDGSDWRQVEADLLLVAGGWSPAVHLYSQAGGRLRYDEGLGAFVPDGCRQAVDVAGAASGTYDLAACLDEGAAAGRRALEAAGLAAGEDVRLPSVPDARLPVPPAHVWLVPAVEGSDVTAYATAFVDLQRDVTVADVARASGAGLHSVEHVKRYTTAGTAHDQGKTSGVLTSGVMAHLLGVDIADLGTTTFRPPYTPVAFATLAGRERGALHDPVRVTSLHGWHVAAGARFENVGQWKRPWYYPRESATGAEDMEQAVLRECRAAREGVAFMDASTLGKIDVQGPDAPVLLDRLYTNMMSTLVVGAIRYGVMCQADGMLLDDGTVTRLADDHYLTTTTTGNAALVLDWMEEWLQTEWPDLRVHLTSVTDHWATVALVGPRSREVLATLAPGLAVDAESFPFMRWRDAEVAGLAARVCRISFSGELAYEITVNAWEALALWEAVYAAGEPFGITPYGTQTMHVLRAEKGYPIVGQDTDGTVTPQDLGMEWIVSKKKAEFVGKRSFSRADTSRPDRKHLVGLLPDDRETVLPEGTQLVAGADLADADRLPPPPVPMAGHVTSSYRSAALGRPFALALVRSGRDRIGERLHAPVGDRLVPATVAPTVLYDPEGTHRDG